jgi:hypothetical protein
MWFSRFLFTRKNLIMKRNFIIGGLVIVIVSILSLNLKVTTDVSPALGSVARSGEYQSTTTSLGRFSTGPISLCSTPGTLGSVIVTGAAAGPIYFYNATTSSVLLRHASLSTSTLILATLPASIAAGTYTYDSIAPTALMMEVSGTMPTTTITYRCN